MRIISMCCKADSTVKININKIIGILQEIDLEEYAQPIKGLRTNASESVKLKALPSFADLSSLKATSPAQIDVISEIKALLLDMTITGKSENTLARISSVVRDNFENVTPLYMIREELSLEIGQHKTSMADIESGRFQLDVTLRTNNFALENFKNIKATASEGIESNVTLQFDIGDKK